MQTARQGWVCLSWLQVCAVGIAFSPTSLPHSLCRPAFLLMTQSYVFSFARSLSDASGPPQLTASLLRPCKVYLGFKQTTPQLSTATVKVGSYRGGRHNLGGSWTHEGFGGWSTSAKRVENWVDQQMFCSCVNRYHIVLNINLSLSTSQIHSVQQGSLHFLVWLPIST